MAFGKYIAVARQPRVPLFPYVERGDPITAVENVAARPRDSFCRDNRRPRSPV